MNAVLALKVFAVSFRLAGLLFLALGIAHLFAPSLALPLDGYGYYLVAFCGCLMIGMSLFAGDALQRATPRKLLQSAAITLLLFAAMRVAYLLAQGLPHPVAQPLLIGEILLFGGVALAFLALRRRA